MKLSIIKNESRRVFQLVLEAEPLNELDHEICNALTAWKGVRAEKLELFEHNTVHGFQRHGRAGVAITVNLPDEPAEEEPKEDKEAV